MYDISFESQLVNFNLFTSLIEARKATDFNENILPIPRL